MPRVPTETLTKITLNLFLKDVEWFRDKHGYGFTEAIRLALRQHIRDITDPETIEEGWK